MRVLGGRTATRVGAVAAIAVGLVLVVAAPASAHADLLESDPASGAVLTEPPTSVTLTFTEPVDAKLSSANVFDADGEAVTTKAGRRPAANSVRVRLPELDEGAYIVTWRVAGNDAHPVQGVFTFQVGQGANATSRELTALGQQLLRQENASDQVVGAIYGVTRWAVFAGLALLIGVAASAGAIWQAGRTSRRVRRLAWAGWGLLAAGTIGTLLIYGPYAQAKELGDVFGGGVLGDTLGTRLGIVSLVRLGILLFAVVPLRFLFSERPLPRWWIPLAGVTGVALAATPGLAGHASIGDLVWLAVPTDTMHVAAMSVWLGGLVTVAVALLPGKRVSEILEPVNRFSRVAFVAISSVIVTGAFQSWRQVRSLEGLRTTEFGRILIVKVVIVAGVVAIAAFSREFVMRMRGGGDRVEAFRGKRVPVVAGGADDGAAPIANDDATWLRRTVGMEAVFAVLILVVTALLVNAPPARSVIERPTSNLSLVTVKSDRVWVDVTASPGRKGRNDVHVDTVRPGGEPLEVDTIVVTLAAPDGGNGRRLKIEQLGDNHYVAEAVRFNVDGDWRVVVQVTLRSGQSTRADGELTIR
jgi:copper transport protein